MRPKCVIRIEPYGQLGNQMLQLMLAVVLKSRLQGSEIVGYDLQAWGLRDGRCFEPSPLSVAVRGHEVPLTQLVDLATSASAIDIHLTGIAFDWQLYADYLDHFRYLFRSPFFVSDQASSSELLINIRLGNLISTPHPDYLPLPIAYYEQLLDETKLAPVFVGEIASDPYSLALRSKFKGARFVESKGALEDFQLVRSAENIAVGISTFSWLAAWLSERACNIFLPIAGLFDPLKREDVMALPFLDQRYRFFASAMNDWHSPTEGLSCLAGKPNGFLRMPNEDVGALLQRPRRKSGEVRAAIGRMPIEIPSIPNQPEFFALTQFPALQDALQEKGILHCAIPSQTTEHYLRQMFRMAELPTLVVLADDCGQGPAGWVAISAIGRWTRHTLVLQADQVDAMIEQIATACRRRKRVTAIVVDHSASGPWAQWAAEVTAI